MADVVMPQMGESIAEGTIVRWIKKVGDAVDLDEPLFEISTDKVDAEIPSPAAGVLTEIRVPEGETVPVHSVVAVIGDTMPESVTVAAPEPAAPGGGTGTLVASVVEVPVAQVSPAPGRADAVPATNGAEAGHKHRSSPVVRRIARDHAVDVTALVGTGQGGRVTKADILAFIQTRTAGASGVPTAIAHDFPPGASVDRVPLSVMRKKIAEHMVASRRTSAHVHSVFEVDYSRVAAIRDAPRTDVDRAGVRPSFLSFILASVAKALAAVPVLNASLDGDTVVYRKDINVGVAVSLDWGLIVPVVKRADTLGVLELSRTVADLATRARARQLKPDEVQGGTFTVTNPGAIGALFGLPIINQPQVAILGVGTIEKRVAVIDDAIGIRLKGYLALGFDHRLIDGAVADQFMALVKQGIERFDPALVEIAAR